MKPKIKTTFLQIRLTSSQKSAIKRSAKAHGRNVSSWVLERLLLGKREQLGHILHTISKLDATSFAFADLSDFLHDIDAREFEELFAQAPTLDMSAQNANILAAMIEYAAVKKNARVPEWLEEIEPLSKPIFATQIKALRQHLLLSSPIPFRKRNLFVDSTVGDRV